MDKKPSYIKLFIQTFLLSAFTFGGGYVIVPLMKKRFVDELGWIEEPDMLDIVALSQSSPGPIAINASILLGYRLLGFRGALVTVAGTAIPPLVVISAISFFYNAFKENTYVNLILKGMGAGVAGIILDVVIKMVKGVKKLAAIALMSVGFILAVFFNVGVIYILIFAGILGIFLYKSL